MGAVARTMFMIPPGGKQSEIVRRVPQRVEKLTDCDVTPADSLLSWFFLDGHCCASKVGRDVGRTWKEGEITFASLARAKSRWGKSRMSERYRRPQSCHGMDLEFQMYA